MAKNPRLSRTNKCSLLWPWPIPKIMQMKKTHFDITTNQARPRPNLFFWILASKRSCRTQKVPLLGPALRISLDDEDSLPLRLPGTGPSSSPSKYSSRHGIFTFETWNLSSLLPDFGFFSTYKKQPHSTSNLKNQHVKDQELSVQWFQPTWNKCVSSYRSFPTKIQVNKYHAWNTHHLVVSCLTFCFQFSLLFVWWGGFMLAMARIP